MKIEAVTVCVNYSDFLEHTLPENIEQLDRLVIVTHPDDKETQRLCTQYSVDFVQTLEMHRDGDKFNKGRAINLGLSHLRHDGWILILDADILLPHRYKQMLHHAQLNPANIYGADRLNSISFYNWEKNKHKITPQHQWRYLINGPQEFPIGSRLLHNEYGYVPIGYHQLFHSTARRIYPIVAGSCEHDDVLFAVQWTRTQRILLPEFFVFHLESEQVFGMNWHGRKSKRFGPKCHDHDHPKPYK